MMGLVHERHGRDHQIVTVWHPEACGDTFETNFGSVRVQVGEPSYQLTTGEKVFV